MALSVDGIYNSLLTGSSTLNTAGSLLSNSESISSSTSTGELQSTIQNAQTDDELMDACKEFEAYFMKQIFQKMQESVKSEEDEGEYTSMFGDMLLDEYAKSATESQSTGLAQQLYDSMKRNTQ